MDMTTTVSVWAAVAAVLVLAWATAYCSGATFGTTPRRVLVLMVSTPDYAAKDYVKLSARVNAEYAKRHGYDFFHAVRREASHGHAVWARVDWIRQLLPKYEYIMYIDGDAVFAQPSVDLTKFFVNDFVGCADYPNGPYTINTGTLIVRNTAWAHGFLEDWARLKPAYLDQFAYEQAALHDLIDRSRPQRVTVQPADSFNSIAADVLAGRRDTFVVHFMATDDDTRLAGIYDIFLSTSSKSTKGPARG